MRQHLTRPSTSKCQQEKKEQPNRVPHGKKFSRNASRRDAALRGITNSPRASLLRSRVPVRTGRQPVRSVRFLKLQLACIRCIRCGAFLFTMKASEQGLGRCAMSRSVLVPVLLLVFLASPLVCSAQSNTFWQSFWCGCSVAESVFFRRLRPPTPNSREGAQRLREGNQALCREGCRWQYSRVSEGHQSVSGLLRGLRKARGRRAGS